MHLLHAHRSRELGLHLKAERQGDRERQGIMRLTLTGSKSTAALTALLPPADDTTYPSKHRPLMIHKSGVAHWEKCRVMHLGGLPALPDIVAADASMLGEAPLLMAIGREDDCTGIRFPWSCCTL